MRNKKVLVFILAWFSFFAVNSEASEQVLDKIMAVIGNDLITLTDVKKASIKIKQNLITQKQPMPAENELQAEVLNHLVNEKIQLQQAKLMQINISEQELNTVIAGIAKSQNLTLEQLKAKIIKSKDSYNDFTSAIKSQLLINKLQKQVIAGKINLTDKELNKFMSEYENQHQKAHIIDWLIEVPENSSKLVWQKKQKLSKQLYQQLKSSGNVSVLAIKSDLGWRSVSDLPDIFINKVAVSVAGEVIAPMKAPNGMHVLQILDIDKSINIDKKTAFSMLYSKVANKEIAKWLDELKKTHPVIIMSLSDE